MHYIDVEKPKTEERDEREQFIEFFGFKPYEAI